MDLINKITPEELAEQKETAKKVLIESYIMYERSIADTLKRRKEAKDKFGKPMYSEKETEKVLQLLKTMQQDGVSKYIELGGTEEELKEYAKGKKKLINRNPLLNVTSSSEEKERVIKSLKEMKLNFGSPEALKAAQGKKQVSFNDGIPTIDIESVAKEKQQEQDGNVTNDKESTMNEFNDFTIPQAIDNQQVIDFKQEKEVKDTPKFEIPKESAPSKFNIGNTIQWDNVPLPSKGECYRSKIDKVPVAYLTAYDENLIVSPNLYKDGTFLDELLKSKIMNSSIDVDNLLPGDRDAIILWLRGTSYGVDFPVTATDGVSGKQFDAVVDLTTIHSKEFKLKGDENGYFDFELPVSKDKIKFRFLTYGDLKRLEELEKEELIGIKKRRLDDIINELTTYVDADDECERGLRKNLRVGIENFAKYRDTLEVDDKAFSHMITNKLILSIASVNGIDNREYINEYVLRMNVRDSSALRKYITENEPGLDFNIEVERPESLGGGSIRMFLTLDQYIFLNIA